MSDKIEIGDKARDKVTKIEGIVIQRTDYLYAMSRVQIKPEGSFEGKQHEAVYIDIAQAELVAKNVIERPKIDESTVARLGDKCKDKISGFEGICSASAEWLYSCIRIAITPDKIEKKTYKPSESQWFDGPQVTVLTEKKISGIASKSTGGPGGKVDSGRTMDRRL